MLKPLMQKLKKSIKKLDPYDSMLCGMLFLILFLFSIITLVGARS